MIKRLIKFQDYKGCLENNKTKVRLQQILRNEAHNIITEKVNKIVLSTNDDKRMQTPSGVTTYPYSYEC